MWWALGSHLTLSRMWPGWINNGSYHLSDSVYSVLYIHYLLASSPPCRDAGGWGGEGRLCSEAQGEERAPCTRSPCYQEGRQGFRSGLPGSRVWALSFHGASTWEATVGCWPRAKEQWLAQVVITATKKTCEFKVHVSTPPAPKMEEEEEIW